MSFNRHYHLSSVIIGTGPPPQLFLEDASTSSTSCNRGPTLDSELGAITQIVRRLQGSNISSRPPQDGLYIIYRTFPETWPTWL
jgi:hypothetical protein